MTIHYTMTSPILEVCDEDNLEAIRSSRRAVFSKAPAIGHIYFLFDGNDVVYVGQTTQGESRIYNHRTNQEYKEFDSFTMLECDIDDLDEIESRWIFTLQPKYNKKLGAETGYYSRVNPKIKDCFPGRAFNHLVENYSIRSIQFPGMKNPRYNLEDLHEAAKIALQTGHLELAKNYLDIPLRYNYISKATAATRRGMVKKEASQRARTIRRSGP